MIDYSAPVVELPPGVIALDHPLVLHDGQVLHGAGSVVTTLTAAADYNGPLVETSGSNITVSGVTLEGSHTAAFAMLIPGTYLTLNDVVAAHSAIGFDLKGTAFGVIENARAENNTGDGFRFTNDAFTVALQWNLINTVSLFNGGWGYHMTSTVDDYATSGQWISPTSFANSAGGFLFEVTSTGANASLNDIRLTQINASTDGGQEVWFASTHGEHNEIVGGLIEAAGGGPTGPDMLTPPSHGGCGIAITGDNIEITVVGVAIRANSDDGVGVTGHTAHLTLVADMISENSQAVAGRNNGITIGDVDALVTIYGTQSYGDSQAAGLWSAAPVLVAASWFAPYHGR